MMNGMYFGDIHSYADLNLILSKVDIPPAAVKTNIVDNPGGDGSWDMTEALGKINYKNRECKFTFSVLPTDDFEAKKTEVSNLLNGRRFKMVLDKDPNYFWDGRCSVNNYESNKKMRKIVVSATVAPYKFKHDKTRTFIPFCGKNLFDHTNLQKIGGSSANIESISTGVRASWVQGKSAYVLVKWLPLEMLIGKTITFSCTIAESGGARGTAQVGYASADGSQRQSKVKLEKSGCISFVVEKTNPNFEYLALWFYANNGGESVSSGAYVDYTNITIELGNTVADRRNLLPYPYPEDTVTGEGVTFTSQGDGGISVTGTATGQKNFTLYYGDLLTDGVITFSVRGNFANMTAVLVLRDEEKETLFNRNVETSITVNLADFPTAKKMEILIKRKINAEVSGTVYPQLEKGAVVTEYTQFVPFAAYAPNADPQEVTLTNGRKTVCPTIMCTGETTVEVNGGQHILGEGTHKVLDIQLREGETTATVTGSGSVAFIYQEGDL